MGKMHFTEPHWTSAMLLEVLERYVVRTRLLPCDRSVLGDLTSKELFNTQKAVVLLDRLVEKADGRLDIYEPTVALMNDLNTLHSFPNNSEFLGMADQMNFVALPKYLQDTNGLEFMSKSDVYLLVFRNYASVCGPDDQISAFVLMSLGNKITRNLKDCYEIIPTTLIDSVCSFSMDVFQKNPVRQVLIQTKLEGLKLRKYTVDELFRVYSKYFDEDFDGKLLKQLKQMLNFTNMSRPIRSNEDFYETVLLKFAMFVEGVQAIVKQFPDVFLPTSHPQNRSKKHHAVLRVFIDGDEKFLMAKDLEYALNIALKNQWKKKLTDGVINIESTEEKQRGILNSVSWDEFEKILESLQLKIEDINIIEHEINRTTREIAVPLISQYGTHCKLATDAFFDVFENVSTGLRLFQAVSKENLHKIFDWFAELHDVFSDEKTGRYFVETWKIDQIIDRAYKELKQYVTEPIYELPNKFNIGFTKDQVIKEVTRFSPNFKLDQQVIISMHFKFINDYQIANLTPRFIHQIYEHCVRLEFFARNPRFSKFLHNQSICKTYPKFNCECSSSPEQLDTTNFAKNLEVLKPINVEAIPINYDETKLGYSVIAGNSEKFYDNFLAFHLALDSTVSTLNENNKELLSLTYKSEMLRKNMSSFQGVFYLTEREMKRFCEDSKKFYDDSIRIAILRGEAQKESLSQTHEMEWDDVWKTFKMYFPDNSLFESVKRNLKNRKRATSKGILGSIITQLTSICRHGQMTFQRCMERMKSLGDFMKHEKAERRIVLRMMSEMRICDEKLWHVFTKEVFQAMKLVLRAEKRLHLMRDRIEKWEMDWYHSEYYTVMSVSSLEPMLRELGIDFHKFLIVPEVNFAKCLIELPLRTDYCCAEVQAPNGEWAAHYTQAQFLIFQMIACDINWNIEKGQCCEHIHSTMNFKKDMIKSMKNLNVGYVSRTEIYGIIGRLSDDDTYYVGRLRDIRTPLNTCHTKRYNQKIKKSEFMELISTVCDNPIVMAFHCNNFFQSLAYENLSKIDEYEVWRVRYVFFDHWLDWVLDDEENDENRDLKRDIQTAWTVCMGHLKISSFVELKKWRKMAGIACNEYTDLKLLKICEEKWKKCQKNNAKYDEKEEIRQHFWDRTVQKKKSNYTQHTHSANKNCCGPPKKETPKKEAAKEVPKVAEKSESLFSALKRGFFNKPAASVPEKAPVVKMEETHTAKKKKKTVEEVLNKLVENMPKLLEYICDVEFEPMEVLECLIEEHLEDELDDEDSDCLTLIMQETSEIKKLEKKLEPFLDFKIEGGGHYFKRKPDVSTSSSSSSAKKSCCPEEEKSEESEESDSELQAHIEKVFKKVMESHNHRCSSGNVSTKTPLKKERRAAPPSAQPAAPVPPVKKVITETKIVESCEKCRDIQQETTRNARNVEKFEKRIGELEKIVDNKEADITVMKSQMTENKKKYREEIQNNREELSNRDSRIQQLQQELKEVYEDLRTEREELYTEAEKNSKLAQENVRKMKVELENSKFAEKNKEKLIGDLQMENEQLKLRIQIFEENRDENRIRELENRLAEMESRDVLLRNVEEEWKNEKKNVEILQNRMAEMEEQNFLMVENYEKDLEDRNSYIESIESRWAKMELTDNSMHAEQYLDVYHDVPEYQDNEFSDYPHLKVEEYETILRFDRKQLVESVEEIVNSFSEKWNDPNDVMLARTEFANFCRKLEVYNRIIEEDYEQICDLRFDELKTLPDFPMPFSAGFLEKYETMLKNWSFEENTEGFGMDWGNERVLEDRECLICATNMHNHQSVTKCAVCCRTYHSECVSEWLKMNSICPVCRSSLPDPKEFPRL